jgi:ATP-dependent RNA helicase DeaD
VHRIGRTGRAGRSGDAISFVTPRERHLLKAIERATRQSLTEMRLPSVADVNQTRVARFHEAITEAMGAEQTGFLRELVLDYEREHDVPAVDVAAALASLWQDGRPLLLEPEPEPAPARQGAPRRAARPRGSSRSPGVPLATYRIAVGRRHKVEPRQIVGAIANEGGLDRADFGRIDIRGDHSLVELPASLSEETRAALATTRISGKLIDLSAEGAGASYPEPRAKPRTKPRTRKAKGA